MKWSAASTEMEMEEIEAVLEKIWDLHDKLSDAIHSISRSHFLHSVKSLTTSSHKNNNNNKNSSSDDVIKGGFVYIKDLSQSESKSAIHEAKSLNSIRTALENLEDQLEFFHYLSAGGMPHTLPTSLVQLKKLIIGVCYDEADQVSSALCLIRSSPNLEATGLRGYEKSDTAQISKNFPDIQDYSGFALDHLEFFCMKYFANEDREVDFLKLIMAKSPMLEEARIELDASVSLEEEIKMLRNLIQLPFPRASPSAKLNIERPKPAS